MTFKYLTDMNLWSLFLSVPSFLLFFSGSGNIVPSASLKFNFQNLSIHDFRICNLGQHQRNPEKSRCNRLINEGIKGKIILQKGNFMPGPDAKPKLGIGVKREIGFFELTREEQTEAGKSSGFYKKIKTKKIMRACSDKNGCFIAKLKPGKYSMLVKEEGQWYANSFGPNNEISEVEVKDGEVLVVEFKISHGAAF